MTFFKEIIVFLPILIVFYIFLAFIYFIIFKSKHFTVKELDERHVSGLISVPMRKFWFWLFDPFYKLLLYFKIPPDALTILSVVLSVVSAFLYAGGSIVLGAWVLAFAGTCDAIDGRLARALGVANKSGEFLDSCLDRVSDISVYLGILYFFRHDTFFYIIVSVIIISTLGISYFKAKAESLGVQNDVGLMQRPERFWVLCLFGILSPLISRFFEKFQSLDVTIPLVLKGSLLLLAILTLITSFVRLINGYRELKK
jgi:CDP-diacylglycerol---glycerol-3-phosphate 3-phosphatidyltransferase